MEQSQRQRLGGNWVRALGYPEYMVSDEGLIGRNNKLLTPIVKNGYEVVRVSVEGRVRSLSVHRLVFSSFRGAIPEGYQVNHIDGDKRNNKLANLETLLPVDNTRHAVRIGLNPTGERVNTAKLTEELVREIRTRYPQESSYRLAKIYGVHPSTIRRACNRNWKHI